MVVIYPSPVLLPFILLTVSAEQTLNPQSYIISMFLKPSCS